MNYIPFSNYTRFFISLWFYGLLVNVFIHSTQVLSLSLPSEPHLNLTTLSTESILVTLNPPENDGGSIINSYKLEWDPDPGVQEIQSIKTFINTKPFEIQSITTSTDAINEVQVVKSSATAVPEVQSITVVKATSGFYFLELNTSSATSGSFQYSGEVSPAYPAASNASVVDGLSLQSIISGMSNIYGSGVTVTIGSSTADTVKYLVTFPVEMGNVPLMVAHTDKLEPIGVADVVIKTEVEGNILSGSFRLTFKNETTSDISFDATSVDMKLALEAIPSIGALEVTRSASDVQRGYEWTIEFISPTDTGHIGDLITSDVSGLSISSLGASRYVTINRTDKRNLVAGTFKLEYQNSAGTKTSNSISYDATVKEFEDALSPIISARNISISRVGPDDRNGYSWSVTFLSTYELGDTGSLQTLKFISSLTGTGSRGYVTKVIAGSDQEVQLISIPNLTFNGQTTNPIPVAANTCFGQNKEIQRIVTSTLDTTGSGGSFNVSTSLQMRLRYGTQVSGWINANPDGSNDCSKAAAAITNELEKFKEFDVVNVTWMSAASTTGTNTCIWTIEFSSTIGNIDQLKVQAKNAATNLQGSFAFTSQTEKDTIAVHVVQDGDINAVKAELEKLSNVGLVSVAESSTNGCQWYVTFLTLAGSPNYIAGTTTPSVTVTVTREKTGTSSGAGGFFALKYKGQTTKYLPYNADSRVVGDALMALDKVGTLAVTRSVSTHGPTIFDPSNGFTWYITFLTALGDVDLIEFDSLDMTGTYVGGIVAEYRKGVLPRFNSGNVAKDAPLGSVILTDLSNLSFSINGLDENIDYYVRAASINQLGQGPFGYPIDAYAVTTPQQSEVNDIYISSRDATSLDISFDAPINQGGRDVTYFMVEYANSPFAAEVQEIKVEVPVVNEVQVITTSTSTINEVQVVGLETSYPGTPSKEIQSVLCDATDGFFKLTFNGETTPKIFVNASSTDIQNALQTLSSINAVTVQFQGPNKACFSRRDFLVNNSPVDGFWVTFDDVVGIAGDLPPMSAITNELVGLRYVKIKEIARGAAQLSGTYRLSFRGSMTDDIAVTASNSDLQSKLNLLDTIQSNGVTVTSTTVGSNTFYSITFGGVDLGGDVEALVVSNTFFQVTGDSAAVNIYSDGTAPQNSPSSVSVRGNQLSGTFRLQYRGHNTEDIDSDASPEVFKQHLEALENIGTVKVTRSGPSVKKEYSWSVTFLSMPGIYPSGSGYMSDLKPVIQKLGKATLGGTNSNAVVTAVKGSPTLSASLAITFSYLNGSSLLSSSISLPADASAVEMAKELNKLQNAGSVSVSKQYFHNGHKWLVTFDGCKVVTINTVDVDVCSRGDVPLLSAALVGATPAATTVVVDELTQGSGACPSCVNYIAYDRDSISYKTTLSNLTPGRKYYVRVSAHNEIGFGYPKLSSLIFWSLFTKHQTHHLLFDFYLVLTTQLLSYGMFLENMVEPLLVAINYLWIIGLKEIRAWYLMESGNP